MKESFQEVRSPETPGAARAGAIKGRAAGLAALPCGLGLRARGVRQLKEEPLLLEH